MELGVLGPLHVRQFGLPVAIPGAKPRAVLTMLGLYGGAVVPGDTLVELLWGTDPPRTAAKALQTHISALRRALGDGFVLTQGMGWTVNTPDIDAVRYGTAAARGREAMAAGDVGHAVACFDEALRLWRGAPELPDSRRGSAERTRWTEGHAALVEDRADALLATGRAAELIGELEAAIAEAPLRERRWGQLMLALYRAGRQGEALAAYQRVRALLADELGVDPGPELRRLESKIVVQDESLELPVYQNVSSVMRAVTFLLTDIEGSTAAWEQDSGAMAVALARHDEIVGHVVTSRGGRLIKTRGEGDATFSVFDRPSGAAAAAVELQEAIRREPWALADPMRIRIALHTGEVEFRDGDYFGRAVNRAARLRSLALGGQILCSGATAELVIDSLADDVELADLGTRQLKNLPRPERVFELRLDTSDESGSHTVDASIERPALPVVLAGSGPFVGRAGELELLLAGWRTTLDAGARAVLISGEPGVGKTRLAGEWSRRGYEQGAVVLYGRCDEDLGAPYQPFAEALRSLLPRMGSERLRGLRGIEALLLLVPDLPDILPELAAPPRADPDTERYALFDAVVAVMGAVSASTPVILVLDDLHWAAKPTLLLLRHLLRFGEHARVQIIGTYRSTDLDRSHPLAAMLADLNRDGIASRLQLGGLERNDVTAYLAAAGYDDEDLARALASVTGGNPFFLIEALRHVDESGGRWDPSTLPQGVREAVTRRLSRLTAETNKALGAAAVVGSRFAVYLVERVLDQDLVDAFDEACKAGIVVEEPGGRYRFNHALVRQSLLAELASVRRMRLHQRIAAALESEPGADDLLAELAYHYFECAWAGNAAKAVDYCRRAADQAMARLAYEGAANLYDRALHALEELDDDLEGRDQLQGELLIARCEALLAAGDVTAAVGAVAHLRRAAGDSGRLAAWGVCFDGQLSALTHLERLDEIELSVGEAAGTLAALNDAAGEAKAHTVRAGCLARLGRIGDCEAALDQALTAARRARDNRRVNAVLANAPLAALWGPNPVPRAGGRCLDVVRLLRITTGSPIVEATSTRCQAVLDAFRGRADAGRQLVDSARRSLSELGMRHALLEVEQFAGIIELVADEPAAAEQHLRRAYHGFRRMGLDADTAETAALLARACLAVDKDAEADELCSESERLAGHALKASISWRTVRAQLLARGGAHDAARQMAEEAVAIAGSTDALVDHGDACLALAVVLGIAGDAVGSRAAADRAAALYESKGAAALAEKARRLQGGRTTADTPAPSEAADAEPENACVWAGRRIVDAVGRQAWFDVEALMAPEVELESRRTIVGFPPVRLSFEGWRREMSRYLELGLTHFRGIALAARGDRLALVKLTMGAGEADPGAPQDAALQVVGLDDEGRVALQVWFDVEDLQAALVELDSRHAQFDDCRPILRLDNAASRVDARFQQCFAARDWVSMAELLDEDLFADDRRRTVNAGVRRGRDAKVADMRATAELGTQTTASTVIAVRGQRLALVRIRLAGRDQRPEAYRTEMLGVVEINRENRMAARILFDLDDRDAAFAELDARYGAGEARGHADAWTIIVEGCDFLKIHGTWPITADFVGVDHRSGVTSAPEDMKAYVRESARDTPGIEMYVEAVHRLADSAAVITTVTTGSSTQGFDAEWRSIGVITFEGRLIARTEVFDVADVDAALARFDELTRPQRLLENEATRCYERFNACIVTGDREGLAAILADDFVADDARRVVGSGRVGRDTAIDHVRVLADLGVTEATSTILATRGNRLALMRSRFGGRDVRPDAFSIEVLHLAEVGAVDQMTGFVAFDGDDLGAAIAELDTRYLAGEAAPFAHAWSVIADAYAAFNRREVAPTSPGWSNVDHRRGAAFAAGDMTAYLSAAWADSPDTRIYIDAVHRLTGTGAVVTHAAQGMSNTGFEAQWRDVNMLTVDGDLITRSELFDADDLDTAIGFFDELSRGTTRLTNAATRMTVRFQEVLSDRDWTGMAQIFAHDIRLDDRRSLVGVEFSGRDATLANMQASAHTGVKNVTLTTTAVRGSRLALQNVLINGRDDRPGAFRTEALVITEVDPLGEIIAFVMFDLDDFDAAIAELDMRYLSGEAAPFAQTFSVVAQGFAALCRREVPPTTAHFVDVDHRSGAGIRSGDLKAYLAVALQDTKDNRLYVEAVHRLSEVGAVITHVAKSFSPEGLGLEWRIVDVLTVEDNLLDRCEMFDEDDLDTALARFDELSGATPRLDNAAIRGAQRFARFGAEDWDLLADTFAGDFTQDDRRRVVGAGTRHGRAAELDDLRAFTEIGLTNVAFTFLGTRGQRLALARSSVWGGDARPVGVHTDMLTVTEVDAGGRISALVIFDPDDLDAAVSELDGRYMAGEGAPYANIWSLVTRTYAAFNRHELSETTPDWVNLDHRLGVGSAAGDMNTYVSAIWAVAPDVSTRIEAVHRLSSRGAVFTHTERGTSQDGFAAEWREVALLTFDGDAINRCELFDERDLDAAVALFDDLDRHHVGEGNSATRMNSHLAEVFNRRDEAGYLDSCAPGARFDDRRRGMTYEGPIDATFAHALLSEAAPSWRLEIETVAIRGDNLALGRYVFRDTAEPDLPVAIETLCLVELDTDHLMTRAVLFDVDDSADALAELDARYRDG